MMDSVSSPLEPKCDSLSVVADVSLALGTNAARNPPPIDLGIVSDRSVVSTAATMENGEDVSSPAVSALMADFDIDSILSPSEDSTRSSLATGATDRTNEETCRGGDFMRSRVYQQNVADDKNVPIGLDSKLGSQIVAEKAVNNNNISAPCSNERNLARVEPHVYRSKSACDKNKTASSNLMTSCIQVQQILQDSATSTSPMANGTNYGLPYLGDRTLKEDLTGMDVQRNAEELEIIVRELRQGLSRVFEQLNSAVDDDSKLKKQLSTHRGELAEVCRLAVGLRNDVSKLSDRQQRLENEFKMLRDEQQIMKLSLMELSQSNRERNKNSFDGEKTFERSSASEEQKKRTPMVENVMKRGDKDIGVSQKFERTFSSCANFLPIDGVDSDVFSTAKENNNSVSKYCDVSSHGLSGFHSGVEESKGEPKTIPTTSSPLCVQSRVENLPANHEPQLNPGISQPNADSKSSVSDLQMESLNSMLKEVLSEETCAIEQVQHLVNYYLKPCRKFDSSASHATVPSGSNTAGGGSKNSVATNGSCQSIQSKNIFPSILRSIKEGMLQIWDALRKCQELLLLQAKSSSGSSAKTGGNGNSGLNGNYMLPVVSEAISKFINEMEAVLTQLASHNDKDLLLNVSLYFTGLPKNFDEFDKTLSNSSLFYNFVQDTVQVTRSKFGARCEHVKQSGDLVKWLHLSPYRFLHSFLRFLQTVSQILTKCSCGERSSAGGSNSHKSCMPSLENNVAMSAGEEQENCLSMIQVAFDLQKDPSMPSTMSNICIESAIKFKRLLTAIHKVDKKASPVLSQLENALKNSVHETILVYSKLPVDQLQLPLSLSFEPQRSNCPQTNSVDLKRHPLVLNRQSKPLPNLSKSPNDESLMSNQPNKLSSNESKSQAQLPPERILKHSSDQTASLKTSSCSNTSRNTKVPADFGLESSSLPLSQQISEVDTPCSGDSNTSSGVSDYSDSGITHPRGIPKSRTIQDFSQIQASGTATPTNETSGSGKMSHLSNSSDLLCTSSSSGHQVLEKPERRVNSIEFDRKHIDMYANCTCKQCFDLDFRDNQSVPYSLYANNLAEFDNYEIRNHRVATALMKKIDDHVPKMPLVKKSSQDPEDLSVPVSFPGSGITSLEGNQHTIMNNKEFLIHENGDQIVVQQKIFEEPEQECEKGVSPKQHNEEVSKDKEPVWKAMDPKEGKHFSSTDAKMYYHRYIMPYQKGGHSTKSPTNGDQPMTGPDVIPSSQNQNNHASKPRKQDSSKHTKDPIVANSQLVKSNLEMITEDAAKIQQDLGLLKGRIRTPSLKSAYCESNYDQDLLSIESQPISERNAADSDMVGYYNVFDTYPRCRNSSSMSKSEQFLNQSYGNYVDPLEVDIAPDILARSSYGNILATGNNADLCDVVTHGSNAACGRENNTGTYERVNKSSSRVTKVKESDNVNSLSSTDAQLYATNSSLLCGQKKSKNKSLRTFFGMRSRDKRKKSSQETLSRPSNSSGSVNNNNNGTLDSTSSRDRRSGTPVASVTPTSTQKVLEYLGDYPPVIPRTPTSFSQNSMSMSDLSILSSSHYYPSHPVAHPPYRHSAITVDTSGGSAAALYYPHSEPPNPHKLPHPTGTHENANGRKQNSHPAHETSVHLLRMSPKKGAGSRKSSQLSDSYSRDVFSHQLFAGGGASFDLNDASVHGVPQGLVQARSKEFERIAKLASSAEDCSNQYDTQRERRNSTTMASATDRNNYVITRNPSQASSANQNHYHDLNVSLNHSSGRNNHVNMMAAYARPRHIL